MKRMLSFLMAFILSIGCIGFSAQAADSASISDLFSTALIADGEDADATASQLYQQFLADSEYFLDELEISNMEIQNAVSELLFYEAYLSDNVHEFCSALTNINTTYADLLLQKFNSYIAQQQELLEPVPSGNIAAFDVETVRKFLDSSLLSSDPYADEEFCRKAAEWYDMDPVLFAETLNDYEKEEVSRVAYQIAYAIKNGQAEISQELAINKVDANLDDKTAAVLSQLQNGIVEGIQSHTFHTNTAIQEQAARSTQVPSIGSIVYSSTTVGSTPVSVMLAETSSTNITRSYYVEIYQVRDGNEYKKAGASMSIPAGSTSARKTFAVTTYATGRLYTRVKVYSSNGGSLLTSRTNSAYDTFRGNWRIQIDLYTSRNRQGDLGLYNASGDLVHHATCLGRSASNGAENVTNGNTPRGDYTGYLDGPKPSSEQDAYGPYQYVRLNPKFSTSRSGLLIHGGRSQTQLSPTNGCVRVFNADQKSIADNITSLVNNYHERIGNINIKVI